MHTLKTLLNFLNTNQNQFTTAIKSKKSSFFFVSKMPNLGYIFYKCTCYCFIYKFIAKKVCNDQNSKFLQKKIWLKLAFSHVTFFLPLKEPKFYYFLYWTLYGKVLLYHQFENFWFIHLHIMKFTTNYWLSILQKAKKSIYKC